MTSAKPGNQPDPDDMSLPLDIDGEPGNPATAQPDPEEEEAAKLGDFA